MSVQPGLHKNHSQLHKKKKSFQQATGYRERASKPLKILKRKKKKIWLHCEAKNKQVFVSALHMLTTNTEAAATCFICLRKTKRTEISCYCFRICSNMCATEAHLTLYLLFFNFFNLNQTIITAEQDVKSCFSETPRRSLSAHLHLPTLKSQNSSCHFGWLTVGAMAGGCQFAYRSPVGLLRLHWRPVHYQDKGDNPSKPRWG